ncbi:MAG: hypothetical protein WCP20_02215 [Desulfuromonadales bacterium]
MTLVLFWGYTISSALAETALSDKSLSEKKVLMLYSYFASTSAYKAITSPMLSILINAGVSGDNLHQEYLDLGRHGDLKYRRNLLEFLKNKYSDVKFDLIVTFHGAAQQFVLQDCRNLWPQAQLLSLLAPGIPKPEAIGRRSGVGLLKLDFRGTLERALELFPQTRRVYFVTGSGAPELKYIEQAKAEFEPWQEMITFEYTVGQSLDEILKRVANLPSGSIAMVSALITDGRGVHLHVAEATKNIAEAANTPAFGFYDTVFGTGIIGGSMVSFDNTGTYAGTLVVDILRGKVALTDPPLILPSLPPVQLFDWPQIKQWKGDVTKLPENSVFLHRPLTLWDQYKTAVIITLVVFLIMAGLVSGLLVQRRHRRLAEEELRASREELREQYDELKSTEEMLREQVEAHEAALGRVKQLEGIIPLCSYCKKIRDDHNSWQQMEQYISDHSEALFSHGICPECAKKLYPEYCKDKNNPDVHL